LFLCGLAYALAKVRNLRKGQPPAREELHQGTTGEQHKPLSTHSVHLLSIWIWARFSPARSRIAEGNEQDVKGLWALGVDGGKGVGRVRL
jgi:hypothetical protein